MANRLFLAAAVVAALLVINAVVPGGIAASIVSAVGAAPTDFAPGYSEESFRQIAKGMTADEVRRRLGFPISVTFRYSDGRVRSFDGATGRPFSSEGFKKGDLTFEETRRLSGEPPIEEWSYSRGHTSWPYKVRTLAFFQSRVTGTTRGMSW